jgi:hypothetical protein
VTIVAAELFPEQPSGTHQHGIEFATGSAQRRSRWATLVFCAWLVVTVTTNSNLRKQTLNSGLLLAAHGKQDSTGTYVQKAAQFNSDCMSLSVPLLQRNQLRGSSQGSLELPTISQMHTPWWSTKPQNHHVLFYVF